MQVPERLALIGGSILLASTLIFTLKSQASHIIPNVGHSISNVYDHIGDAQNDFDNKFQQAQKDGGTTGTWGTSKYYIDKDNNLHIGAGQLQGKMAETIDRGKISNLKTIDIDQSVQAPQDSSYLLSPVTDRLQDNNESITAINGLNNLNTSQATNMMGMFADYSQLSSLDMSSFNTHNVQSMLLMFNKDLSLKDVNMKDWDTSNVNDMGWMFYGIPATKLDLSSFNTNNVHSMYAMYKEANSLSQLTLGQETKNTPLSYTALVNGNWKHDNQTLNSNDVQGNSSIPGTWIRQ